jgi:hypothetical protein
MLAVTKIGESPVAEGHTPKEFRKLELDSIQFLR